MRLALVLIISLLGMCACNVTAPAETGAPSASSTASATSSATVPASNAAAPAAPSSTTSATSAAASSSTVGAAVSGSVWHDVCDGGGGEAQAAPAVPPAGCVAGAAGGFVADGTRAPDEPPVAQVQVTIGTGACPATPTASTQTDPEGRWAFANLAPGTYCVGVDALNEANVPLLLPGSWTAPTEAANSAVAGVTVPLGANEQRTDIAFGWDYQLLP